MKEIGSCSVRQELLFIPAQIKRLDHIQHAYKCQCCSLKKTSDKIVKAPVPNAPLAHSYGSASVIAHTIYQKYELKVGRKWGCLLRAGISSTSRSNLRNITLSHFINCLS